MSTQTMSPNRESATRRVMMTIAVGPDRVELPYTAPDGSQPLVITTPSEYLSSVIERVHTVGGSANIALAEARKFRIFTIEGELVDTDAPVDDDMDEKMSMGMFWLQASRRGEGTFRLRKGGANVSAVSREFAYA